MNYQMTRKELTYQRLNMYETMKVQGVPCKIFPISKDPVKAYDFYQDIVDKEFSYIDYIDTWMTYEEYPSVKTLKSLGWYIEDSEQPAIGYIPVYYPLNSRKCSSYRPSIDDRVDLVTNPYDDNPSLRSFLIKDFSGNGFPSTIYYKVKLVPYREDKSEYGNFRY